MDKIKYLIDRGWTIEISKDYVEINKKRLDHYPYLYYSVMYESFDDAINELYLKVFNKEKEDDEELEKLLNWKKK